MRCSHVSYQKLKDPGLKKGLRAKKKKRKSKSFMDQLAKRQLSKIEF